MNLNEWCDLTGKSKKTIARELGGISPRNVFRWASAEIFPKPPELIKIIKITNGAVTADDFLKAWEKRHVPEKI
tara:strand:- start:8079 stop:8300 length:222 start_codon:yes stop_codon:yes gene_type:complete